MLRDVMNQYKSLTNDLISVIINYNICSAILAILETKKF